MFSCHLNIQYYKWVEQRTKLQFILSTTTVRHLSVPMFVSDTDRTLEVVINEKDNLQMKLWVPATVVVDTVSDHFEGSIPPCLSTSLSAFQPSHSLRSHDEKLLRILKTCIKTFGQLSSDLPIVLTHNLLPIPVVCCIGQHITFFCSVCAPCTYHQSPLTVLQNYVWMFQDSVMSKSWWK